MTRIRPPGDARPPADRCALPEAAEPQDLPVLADMIAAHARIAPHVRRTPVLVSEALDALSGARLLFKCENLQEAGAFKVRGACNAVFSLDAAQAGLGRPLDNPRIATRIADFFHTIGGTQIPSNPVKESC